MNERRDERTEEWIDDEPAISLRELAATLKRYKAPILLTSAAVVFFWLVGLVALILLSPSERIAELPFRLEFKGAEQGEYPNGSKFEPTEILSGPVLLSVYNQNELERYLPFGDFRSAVFVLQSNAALEQLTREYRARLSDPKLSAIDRERLEAEFAEKAASISKSDYSLTFTVPRTTPMMPRKLQSKLLSDIMQEWARQTIQNKGVVLYDLSILSSGIFEPDAIDRYDYVIGLDMLRKRIERVVANIDQLLEIPGAKVVRTRGPEAASLAELRVRLKDTLQFRVQPLLGAVIAEGFSRQPATLTRFLETRLQFNELERREAENRAEAVRESLLTYVRQQPGDPSAAQRSGQTEPFSGGSTTVIPQLGDSFLQQIVDMATNETDLEYRQRLIDQLRTETLEVVPLQAEADYYRQLLESVRGFEARRPQAAEIEDLRTQIAAATADAVTITNHVNEIYREISQNLNPSTVLYSTQPTFFTIERSVVFSRALLAGALLLVVATFAAVAGALIHDRITARREPESPPAVDEADDAKRRTRTQPGISASEA